MSETRSAATETPTDCTAARPICPGALDCAVETIYTAVITIISIKDIGYSDDDNNNNNNNIHKRYARI